MKKIEVVLENRNPVGDIIKSTQTSLDLYDGDSMIKNRLFIHIGECLYSVDERGFIIERIIPKYPA